MDVFTVVTPSWAQGSPWAIPHSVWGVSEVLLGDLMASQTPDMGMPEPMSHFWVLKSCSEAKEGMNEVWMWQNPRAQAWVLPCVLPSPSTCI